MALKVIGSGLGRTGTLSLKGALERLGFGPCHHMIEVFQRPNSVPLWVKAGEGQPDWETIFKDFNSMVDYPGCKFWRELAAYYPAAKILHSVRDPDAWFESTQATIFSRRSPATNPPQPLQAFFSMLLSSFGDKIHDRDFMVAYFKQHTEEVVRAFPKERLLVYETGQGWAPLCNFLGVPIPDEPFPQVNKREEFIARAAAAGRSPSH